MRGLPQHNRASREATLNFQPPTSVKVAGSFLLRTMSLPRPCIDVAVEMPSSCFHERDLKNYTYMDKRNLYLGVLAKHLARCDGVKRVDFESVCLDTHKPVLLITPGACGRGGYQAACSCQHHALRCIVCVGSR